MGARVEHAVTAVITPHLEIIRPYTHNQVVPKRAAQPGVEAGNSSLQAIPTTDDQASAIATPRLNNCPAMISRWISDVPSHNLSTRSSRKKRSATFSRM